MIRIVKPAKPPKILTTKGAEQTQNDCIAYDNNPAEYRSGERKFDADRRLYSDESVKDTLMDAQHKKCCYCESKLPPTSYGDVEHYRPKGAVRQAPGQSEEYPGYYWLAYDWSNLLVSCTPCNLRKGTLFPLMDPDARVRSHQENLEAEQPLFIHPAMEDPRDHIRFRGDTPEPRTPRGQVTIERLGLRHTKLEEARRERLAVLESYRETLELLADTDKPALQQLRSQATQKREAALHPAAEYSAMAQDFFSS
jgi:uncharacterized protein (TIGR02646 family)